MQFIIDKSTLSKAFQTVSKACATKTTIPALEGVLIALNGTELTLSAFDLEVGIVTKINVQSLDMGCFVAPAKMFTQIIANMPNGDIEITVEDGTAVLKCGKSKCKTSVIDGSSFPDLPTLDDIIYSFSIDYTELKSMINQSVFAASTIETKPILTGELFEIDNGAFNLVAIDGYRLAIRSCNIPCEDNYKFVVPAKTLREIASISNDTTAVCQISISKKHAIFNIGSVQVYTRLLEGEFHNYKSSMPTKSTTTANVKVSELISILNRCQIILNEKAKAPIICNFENGELSVKCKTQLGTVEDSMSVDMWGGSLKIGFNNRYLLEALKVCECDVVRIEMTNPLSTVVILPPKGEEFKFLVLPVNFRNYE